MSVLYLCEEKSPRRIISLMAKPCDMLHLQAFARVWDRVTVQCTDDSMSNVESRIITIWSATEITG